MKMYLPKDLMEEDMEKLPFVNWDRFSFIYNCFWYILATIWHSFAFNFILLYFRHKNLER